MVLGPLSASIGRQGIIGMTRMVMGMMMMGMMMVVVVMMMVMMIVCVGWCEHI